MRFLKSLALGLGAVCLCAGGAFAVESLSTPTGVHVWNKYGAYDGYTLLSPNMTNDVYLIDMKGDVVHTWHTAGKPGLYAELLPNGNLLRGIRYDPKHVPFGGVSGGVQEIDWDGNVVWEHKIHGPRANQHHAFSRMPNGNTLIVAWQYKSYDEAVAKGRRKGTLPAKADPKAKYQYDGLWEDYIVEVDKDGREVWSWHTWDHIGKGKDKLDINYKLPIANYYGDSDWVHINCVTYIPETDQILFTARNFGEVFLVDKSTGRIAFRWGNPTTHDPRAKKPGWCDDGDQKLFGPHDATWLGDGRIMLFDNGWNRPSVNRSRAVIINSKTGELEWEYRAQNPNGFYSAYQGAAQMLPNGNVLITSTNTGHIFEVTRGKKPHVVWEYVSPWTLKGPVALLEDSHSFDDPTGLEDINIMSNFVHRAFRYGKDYPGLKGRDLPKAQVLFPKAPRWYELWDKAAMLKPAEIR